MISHKMLFLKGLLAFSLLYPQASLAGGFTAADVLEWDEENQDNYFNTSIGMIAIVATQTGSHGDIATCLNDWYWDDQGARRESNNQIREVLERLPEHHPQALVLAVVERECGSFNPG